MERIGLAVDARCARMAALAAAAPSGAALGSTAAGSSPAVSTALPPGIVAARATGGAWGYDPELNAAASADALASGRGPARLMQDALVTAGIFTVAFVLLRAAASRGAAAGGRAGR